MRLDLVEVKVHAGVTEEIEQMLGRGTRRWWPRIEAWVTASRTYDPVERSSEPPVFPISLQLKIGCVSFGTGALASGAAPAGCWVWHGARGHFRPRRASTDHSRRTTANVRPEVSSERDEVDHSLFCVDPEQPTVGLGQVVLKR